jgi:hypothetical protein
MTLYVVSGRVHSPRSVAGRAHPGSNRAPLKASGLIQRTVH